MKDYLLFLFSKKAYRWYIVIINSMFIYKYCIPPSGPMFFEAPLTAIGYPLIQIAKMIGSTIICLLFLYLLQDEK